MKPIHVKDGQALIFNSRLLHYSSTNNSNKSRTSIINSIISQDAQLFSYIGKEEKGTLEVSKYKVPKDFFFHYSDFNNQKDLPNSKGEFVELIDYSNTERVSQEDFKALLKSHKIKKKGWFS